MRRTVVSMQLIDLVRVTLLAMTLLGRGPSVGGSLC